MILELLFSTICLYTTGPQLEIKEVVTFRQLDEEGLYIERPVELSVDEDENLYVLDFGAKQIFVWDKQGEFIRSIGRPGKGPGEFAFTGEFSVFMAMSMGKIIVYDGLQRVIHRFDKDGTFIDARPVRELVGRSRYFGVTASGRYVFYQSKTDPGLNKSFVFHCDEDFSDKKDLFSFEEKVYEPLKLSGSGDVTSWKVNLFLPRPAIYADGLHKTVILGTNKHAGFDLHDGFLNKKKRVTFSVKRQPVSDHEKEVFSALPNFGKNDQLNYPDFKPHYNRIFPLSDDRFLVLVSASIDPLTIGIVLDQTGKTLGNIEYDCGEGGFFKGSGGRLFAIKTDENGNFQVQELVIGG